MRYHFPTSRRDRSEICVFNNLADITMSKESSDSEVTNADNCWDYLSWEFLLGMRAQSMGRDQNELV
jgi:hypothetical protein